MNKHVTVAEIGPRDGFQSISCMMIPTETKLEIIEAILSRDRSVTCKRIYWSI